MPAHFDSRLKAVLKAHSVELPCDSKRAVHVSKKGLLHSPSFLTPFSLHLAGQVARRQRHVSRFRC